ncbi:hypothetical protein [Nocardioides convexus]|uniref:hypothetical protein n=1 Tax=Nocardioides convexus TaxID=2712224 RepID=UPI0024183E5B|nr:hypothetical protein [Nocardioides convexus]
MRAQGGAAHRDPARCGDPGSARILRRAQPPQQHGALGPDGHRPVRVPRVERGVRRRPVAQGVAGLQLRVCAVASA